MEKLLKKPYEISIWEDRPVTENDISYYKEIKLAVIGSDRMESANKVFDIVLTENVNGEKTLTFSLMYRYFDELTGDFVVNPYYKYLLNERKVKLYYNDEWFEFLIKECDESSEDYIYRYTARELFSLELSKTGYDVTLDQSLNNNQGTIVELAEKVLENTDWQVDKENSDLLQQYVSEPLYQCTVENQFLAKNLKTDTDITIEANEIIYVFYSYINNKITNNVQFIRESDRDSFLIDDNNVIRSTNYRFLEEVTYQITDDQVIGINNDITVDSLFFQNQGQRLVYGQQTLYDPIMNRTVDLYQAEYEDGKQDIYHYTDYTYSTSDVVTSYITNGTNFNVFEDGSLQGWSNKTPISSLQGKNTLQPLQLVTRPEISSNSPLSLIETFGNINGYLQLKFNNVLNEDYENTYFNSGFDNNTSLIDHISAGEKFALRLRYFTSNNEHDATLIAGAPSPSSINDGIRIIVAQYEQVDQLSYLDDSATKESKIQAYKILPSAIILDFDEAFVKSPNLISNGTFNEQYTQYIVDHVIQSPSALYHYKDMNTGEERVWDGEGKKYVRDDGSYADYYLTTTKAKTSYSNEQLHDPKLKLGVFIYTKDNSLVDKYIYIQDIQLTRYYENSNGEPVLIGNVPTATSIQNDYFYLKPKTGIQKNDITTYGDLDFLAAELGLDSSKIKKIYNENCEKILSIQASASNCFNILQDLCETFECWLQIRVVHDDTGAIKLDKNFNPIKKVAFKQYSGKENFSGFKKGINLSTINRTIDSNEIVTKLIVESVQSEYVDGGSVSIQNAPSNPSGESTIINLSYYLNRGLITDAAGCNQDLLQYYDNLKHINSQISDLNLQNTQAKIALTRLSANRNTFTALIDEAKESYNEAIQDFYELTGMDYDQYVIEHNKKLEEQTDEDAKEKELLENDTVFDVIAKIYATTAAINNYTGLLTNLNDEYQQLDLLCNGAKDYNISITSIADVEGQDLINPSTQVVFDDYVSGVKFKLYDINGSYEVYTTSPNDRIFNITSASPYKYFEFISIPDNYQVQYYVQNKQRTIPKDEIIGQKFSIIDSVSGKVYNRRFKLIPNQDYAEAHVGYEVLVKDLIEQKKTINKEFYKKYSRFLQEGTWSSQDYIDSELYYLDALQVSSTSAQPKVSYTVNVLEVSQLENLENYDFRVGDKTYIEDADFFGYIVQSINYADGANPLIVSSPVQEEVIVSEVEWHLDKPDENTITIQNYKTQFEDLFQRISATVQTVQRNENIYPKTTAILGSNGLINSSLLADSISMSGTGFALTSNGSVTSTNDGLVIRDLTNSANVMRLASKGIQVSTDGGTTWGTAISADGISAEQLTAGTINTQKIWLMDGNNPSFRWDKAGLNAYGLDENGNNAYDLKTYVRFDKYGLYGIKNNEDYVASSLSDVRDKAFFGITWDGFFIKNSYTDGEVSITSDDDIVVKKGGIKKIHIGAIEKDDDGAPTEYGIKIRNDNGDTVFETGDDGNLSVTGTINALQGNFSGQVSVGNPNSTHIIIDGREENPTISSSNYSDGAGLGWIINGEGDATFSNVSVRGAIKTAVFEYEEIQAVGGAFLFRPSSTIKTARYEPSEVTITGEDGQPMQIETYYHYENDELVYNDLIVTVEKPLMFRKNNWVKISNYNQLGVDPAADLTTYGLVHIYKVSEVDFTPHSGESTVIIDEDGNEQTVELEPIEPSYELTLAGGCAILDNVTIENIPGGALIDFGSHAQKEGIDVPGEHNYGIGINSSDNYVNLPARAISLFETTIHPNNTTKVTYNYRGILGTLPRLEYTGANPQVSSLYHDNLEGTQGIYTDNMYLGDASQYLTFYTDKTTGEKQLKIKASQVVYEVYDPDTHQPTGEWNDINDTAGQPGPAGQDAITVKIESNVGNEFILSNERAILTCTVYKGIEDITSTVTKFLWIKNQANGEPDTTWNTTYEDYNLPYIEVTPSEINKKAVFGCRVTLPE